VDGGASVALAETLASWAATLTIDPDRSACVGIEINANHLRPVRDGWVTGVVRPVMQGRSTQVWEIRITDDAGWAGRRLPVHDRNCRVTMRWMSRRRSLNGASAPGGVSETRKAQNHRQTPVSKSSHGAQPSLIFARAGQIRA
jgi:hypothetical protein